MLTKADKHFFFYTTHKNKQKASRTSPKRSRPHPPHLLFIVLGLGSHLLAGEASLVQLTLEVLHLGEDLLVLLDGVLLDLVGHLQLLLHALDVALQLVAGVDGDGPLLALILQLRLHLPQLARGKGKGWSDQSYVPRTFLLLLLCLLIFLFYFYQ